MRSLDVILVGMILISASLLILPVSGGPGYKMRSSISRADASFLDDNLDYLYKTEQRTGNIALIFTFLAIFISCIGLFGLAAYIAERRTKEIGIRKVLGSSLGELLSLLTKDIFKLVIISSLIALPFSYYIMNRWLHEFAYKISLGFELFLIPCLITLLIAVLTVSFQAAKAAIVNPIDSLKYE